jgi:hypothetical protein
MATHVRRVVDAEDVVDDAEVSHRSVSRAPWSPAQIVSMVIGAIFIILGGIALAKTGMNFSDVSAKHATVAGMDHTAILGLIELVIGLFLIGAGAMPGAARGSMIFFGVLLLGMGIITAAAGDSTTGMHKWLGDGGGWFFAICGVILLVTAMAAPVFFGDDRSRVSRRTVVEER